MTQHVRQSFDSLQLKRRKAGDPSLLSDEELEEELRRTWEESITDDEVDDDDWDLNSNEEDDVIEVYDEDGELVCTYSAKEYAEIRASD